MVRNAWKFLTPYMNSASAFVFSRRAYVWDGPGGSRIHIIPPCIDPFTTKNRNLAADEVARSAVVGLLQGCDRAAALGREARLRVIRQFQRRDT